MDKSLRPRHHDARPIQKLVAAGSPRAARFVLQVLKHEHADYYYSDIMYGLRARHPQLVAPVVLRHLKDALAHSAEGRLIANDLDILGPIVRHEPPIDLEDTAALDLFMKAAHAWCTSHPSE